MRASARVGASQQNNRDAAVPSALERDRADETGMKGNARAKKRARSRTRTRPKERRPSRVISEREPPAGIARPCDRHDVGALLDARLAAVGGVSAAAAA